MYDNSSSRRINILRDSVARRIAAGEVIDRPQAVVRELLDNSIDAASTEINLFLKGGGVDEIRVIDNGSGMDADNLKKCILAHATSKITDFEDIYKTDTLGFRGEALSSIAACSRLTITSAVDNEGPANRIDVLNGQISGFESAPGKKGSIISVRDLFYSMPGRRNFLKSSSAESALCRATFIEKALPQNEIGFKYFADEKLKLFIPPSGLKERVLSAYGSLFNQNFLTEFSDASDGFSLTAVAGSPSLYRKDRKYIHVFINNRRINDYALVQAVDYAYSSYLPGGCHPVCFLFLNIPPENVDFNIHPAKREVKFRNLPGIHHFVTEAVSVYLGRINSFSYKPSPLRSENISHTSFSAKPSAAGERQHNLDLMAGTAGPHPSQRRFADSNSSSSIFRKKSFSQISNEISMDAENSKVEIKSVIKTDGLIYLGQIFNLFLIYEYGNELLMVDQHAAHERIIFNSLSSSAPEIQELLVPLRFTAEKNCSSLISRNLDLYKQMGFSLQQTSDGDWLINAMPAVCSGMEDSIISYFRNEITTETELKKQLYATISCKSAIKDGDRIDEITALELAVKVLELVNPRCPHGRPIIQTISREELFKMFGRTF